MFFITKLCFTIFSYFSGCVDSRPRRFFGANMDPTGRDTTQQGIKIIEEYFTAKPVLLTRQCMRGFDRNNVPDRGTIQRLVVKFRKTVSVTDGQKDHKGRHRWAIYPANIQHLQKLLEESPENQHVLSRKKLGRKMGVDMNTVIYQQDGEPPHCSDRHLEFFGRYFPVDRLIWHRTNFPWLPYSPDLNPCAYLLWKYLMERIYDNNLQIVADLKENIRREISCIPSDMIVWVIDSFNVRVASVTVKEVSG